MIMASAVVASPNLGHNQGNPSTSECRGMRTLGIAALLCLMFVAPTISTPQPPGKSPATGSPLSPREEQATIRVPPGFRVELVAAEPEVIDPVAMAFDEDGNLYV